MHMYGTKIIIPPASDSENTMAFALATWTQWSRGRCRRLLLIRADTAPSLAMPSHVVTYSPQFGINRHTTSPRLRPR